VAGGVYSRTEIKIRAARINVAIETTKRGNGPEFPVVVHPTSMKKTSLFLRTLLTASLLLAMSGCVAAIGNRPPPQSSATLGQQLIDLKRARDEGVITEAEYVQKREQFLAQK
jgi:hypothetical protein